MMRRPEESPGPVLPGFVGPFGGAGMMTNDDLRRAGGGGGSEGRGDEVPFVGGLNLVESYPERAREKGPEGP